MTTTFDSLKNPRATQESTALEIPAALGIPEQNSPRVYPLLQSLPKTEDLNLPKETVVGLVLNEATVQISVLNRNQKLEISATGLKCDIDGTVINNSVEHLHDGPGARYGRNVLQLLGQHFADTVLLKRPESEGTTREEVAHQYLMKKFVNDPGAIPDSSAHFREIGADYAFLKISATPEYAGLARDQAWDKFWCKEFKKLTGKSDDAVTLGMVNKLNALFDAKFKPEDLDRAMKQDVENNRHDYLTHIALVPHIDTLLAAAGASGLGKSLCTSSPEWLIRPLLRYFQVLHHFPEGEIYSASKKFPDGYYSGIPFNEAARNLGSRPVAIGDTVTDAVSAALSGSKDIIIRFEPQPEKSHDELASTFIKKVAEALRKQRLHPNLTGDINIYVVEDWRRVEIMDSGGKNNWRISPAEDLPEYRKS